MNFHISSKFSPTGDQPQAIDELAKALILKKKDNVLIGVTGSGKTYTVANIIEKLNKPALVISHNKTLAAQTYQELRDFFPKNAVSYFVSYYDYYQPESYLPSSDTYIEKETEINEEIDKLRLAATTNLLSRKDTVIVASVSCIYNIGSPNEYGNFVLDLVKGMQLAPETISSRLVALQYKADDFEFKRGIFRKRGDYIDIFPAYSDSAIRIKIENHFITLIEEIEPVSMKKINSFDKFRIFPAKHYMVNPVNNKKVFEKIKDDLDRQIVFFKSKGKEIEAFRIRQRVLHDLEMIEELGYVNGIENYSRYFDGRKPGDPPYTLLDYYEKEYKDDWILVIDESHITVPQIRGMYNGDRSRKQTLVDFGFRLPSALDNRPLNFVEFLEKKPATIYVSATPSLWETDKAKKFGQISEQLIRPTGILDPKVEIRPSGSQVADLTKEILIKTRKKERVLITVLTKRMAEDLSEYLSGAAYQKNNKDKKGALKDLPKVAYLHSEIETLERSDLLDDLREGKYDCLVGINLLREGLDLPEVSLVAILDADKEGFLRSETSLIQTMGRAARHANGKVIMYADKITSSMERAIREIKRRRNIQAKYNKAYNIKPSSIIKPIRKKLIENQINLDRKKSDSLDFKGSKEYLNINPDDLLPSRRLEIIRKLKRTMKEFAKNLDFEQAARIRDKIKEIEITL